MTKSVWCLCIVHSGLLASCTDVSVTTMQYDERRSDAQLDIHKVGSPTNALGVVYIHGGGWSTGKRKNDAATADRLARAGYVVANIDYRLVPKGTFPLAVQDAFCALAFVQIHAVELGIDPNRIAVMGHSAGGHLAGMLAVARDNEVQDPGCPWGRALAPSAAVSVAGPMNLRTISGPPVTAFVGATLSEDPARYDRASPISRVAADSPPFLFVHSKGDLVVNISQSHEMAHALDGVGASATMMELEGGGHVIGDGPGLGLEEFELATDAPEAFLAIDDFLSSVQ
jgi:acetyl esterase/lipase